MYDLTCATYTVRLAIVAAAEHRSNRLLTHWMHLVPAIQHVPSLAAAVSGDALLGGVSF